MRKEIMFVALGIGLAACIGEEKSGDDDGGSGAGGSAGTGGVGGSSGDAGVGGASGVGTGGSAATGGTGSGATGGVGGSGGSGGSVASGGTSGTGGVGGSSGSGGTSGVAVACSTSAPCPTGWTCAEGACHLICTTTPDCGGAGICIGTTLCTRTCKLEDPAADCGSEGLGCFVATGVTDCIKAGTSSTSCAIAADCIPGYTCVGNLDCRKWCRVGHAAEDCPPQKLCQDGSLIVEGVQYGVCSE